MFENKVYENIYYSRFVASWVRGGGRLNYSFKRWLESLTINGKKIPKTIIAEIFSYGTNGKLELEESARCYLERG